jgi:hypothetical protein
MGRSAIESVRRTSDDRAMPKRRSPRCVTRSGEARARPLEEIVRLPRRSPLLAELERGLGAASRLHVLHTDLERVPVRPTATRSEAGAYRYRRRDPVDLRVSRLTGRIASSFLHELGHFVDHQLGWDPTSRGFASATHPAFADWRSAAERLEIAAFRASTRIHRYFRSHGELWARCYAQTALLRSPDPALRHHLAELHAAHDPYVWPPDAFAPVAREVARVFERLGLTPAPAALAA